MMTRLFSDLAKLAVDYAPSIAESFLGPAANFALHLISDKVGGSIDDPGSILEALKGSESISDVFKELETKYGSVLKSMVVTNKPSCVKVSLEINWPQSNQGTNQ